MTTIRNSLIILDSSIPAYEFNKILEIDSDIIAVDYKTHTKLVNSNKKHELLDNYLEENERIDLYNFVCQSMIGTKILAIILNLNLIKLTYLV